MYDSTSKLTRLCRSSLFYLILLPGCFLCVATRAAETVVPVSDQSEVVVAANASRQKQASGESDAVPLDAKTEAETVAKAVAKAEADAEAEVEAKLVAIAAEKEIELEKMDSFATRSEDGEEMICDPDELLNSGVEGGLEVAVYDCRNVAEVVAEPATDERGRGEAEALKNELLEAQGKNDKSVVVVLKDNEDVHSEESAPTPFVVKAEGSRRKKRLPIKFYLSLRGHLSDSGDEQQLGCK